MRSATSYFKISPAVIRDDLKRFWAVPVFSFVFLFFSCIFYLLMNMKDLDNIDNIYLVRYVDNLLTGQNAAVLVDLCAVSVLSVLLVFRYLHNTGHVLAVHSQPFTRATLMNSHTVSCIIFTITPILLIGLILLVIARPCYYSQMYYAAPEDMVNVFARTGVLRWMLECAVCALFVIAVSIIGGMATGTSFHHAVAALGFNGVLPLCTGMLTLYFEKYLFGYTTPNWLEPVVMHMSPVLKDIDSGFMSGLNILYFLALTVLLYAGAMALYYRRKLERAGEGIVFKAFDVAITLVFGYLGMTSVGMTFSAIFDQSAGATAVGYVVGALLGMLVIRMIIMKSVKIFNRGTAILLGVYLVIAAVFLAGLIFDLTGYEKRVPQNATHVTMETGLLEFSNGRQMPYNDPDAVEQVKALHQYVVNHKDECQAATETEQIEYYEDYDYSFGEDMVYLEFSYYTGEPGAKEAKLTERRNYRVPVYLLLQSEEMETLFDSGSWGKAVETRFEEIKNIRSANINSGAYERGSAYGTEQDAYLCTDPEKLASLTAALKADYAGITTEKLKESYNRPILGCVSLNYVDNSTATETELSEEGKIAYTKEAADTYLSAYFEIYPYFTNTIAWIQENGYGSMLQLDLSRIAGAVVTSITDGIPDVRTESWYDSGVFPAFEQGAVTITDPQKLLVLFENCRSHTAFGPLKELSTGDDNIYAIRFYESTGIDGQKELNSWLDAYIDGKYLQ
ncbi:MAG: hypothetical protein ACI4VM_08865 [Anaerovoracaceae bacterium]